MASRILGSIRTSSSSERMMTLRSPTGLIVCPGRSKSTPIPDICPARRAVCERIGPHIRRRSRGLHSRSGLSGTIQRVRTRSRARPRRGHGTTPDKSARVSLSSRSLPGLWTALKPTFPRWMGSIPVLGLDTALATSQTMVFWRRDARHGGPGHLRAPFGLTAAPEDALRAQLDPGCLPLRPPSVSMGLGLADEALRSAPRCGRTARAAPPPPPSGRSRSGRGRSPSRRSSSPFPAGSSATTARPRPAVRACGGSWPGCRQRVELEAHRVGPEGRARQPRPLDGVLALLDVLLRRAAPVEEGDDLLGRATQVRHDEADARIQLAGMPLDLRDHPARPVPALRPIAEARIEASDILRGAPGGPREQRIVYWKPSASRYSYTSGSAKAASPRRFRARAVIAARLRQLKSFG